MFPLFPPRFPFCIPARLSPPVLYRCSSATPTNAYRPPAVAPFMYCLSYSEPITVAMGLRSDRVPRQVEVCGWVAVYDNHSTRGLWSDLWDGILGVNSLRTKLEECW